MIAEVPMDRSDAPDPAWHATGRRRCAIRDAEG